MGKLSFTLATTLGVLAIQPAQAQVVYSNNFDGENGGNTALNYNSFNGLAVTGNVDLTRSGDYYACAGGSGSCVDLDGTTGPGTLTSNSFSFGAGDTVRFSFDLAGNSRNGESDTFFAGFTFAGDTQLLNYGYNFFGSDSIVFSDITTTGISTSTSIAGNAPFSTRSIFFTAGNAGSLTFNLGTNSADNVGPVADNLSLSIAGVPEPATWGMLILGFGATGTAMRRRTRATVRFAHA